MSLNLNSSRGSYLTGRHIAFASPTLWLIADVDPASPFVISCWETIKAGSRVEDVLAIIMLEGFRTVPSFVVLKVSTGSVRVVVKGQATADVEDTEGHWTELADDGQPPWADHELSSPLATIRMRATGGVIAAPELPLVSGVALASQISISLPEGQSPLAAARVSDLIAQAPAQSHASPKVFTVVKTETEAELVDEVAGPPSFDYLFGETQRPPALNEATETAKALEAENAAAPAVPTVAAKTLRSETLRPEDTIYPTVVAKTRLIDSLPWAQPSPPSPEVPAEPVAQPNDEPAKQGGLDVVDEPSAAATVNRAALLAAAALEPLPLTGPTVQAAECTQGHLSPVYASHCRICAEPLHNQDGFTAPRPILGVLKLSTGDVVTLDRGVVLGRAPHAPDQSDPERPNVVRLASPDNDISRNHVEVRLDGWHVLVTDLGSTNGTFVTLPGQAPLKLRPHDALAIEPGTEVSLADEVTFTFEVS